MGDAFAVALMEARGFGEEDFARFHPGGALGRRLLNRVDDDMVRDLPLVEAEASFTEVVTAITGSRLGLTLVQTVDGMAIVTVDDLRHALEKFGRDAFDRPAAAFMTRNQSTVDWQTRVSGQSM